MSTGESTSQAQPRLWLNVKTLWVWFSPVPYEDWEEYTLTASLLAEGEKTGTDSQQPVGMEDSFSSEYDAQILRDQLASSRLRLAALAELVQVLYAYNKLPGDKPSPFRKHRLYPGSHGHSERPLWDDIKATCEDLWTVSEKGKKK